MHRYMWVDKITLRPGEQFVEASGNEHSVTVTFVISGPSSDPVQFRPGDRLSVTIEKAPS